MLLWFLGEGLSVNIPVRRKILGKFKAVFFSTPFFWALQLAWDGIHGCVITGGLVVAFQLWQEGKRPRQAVNLARGHRNTMLAAHCCNQLLLLVRSSSHNGSGNIGGIKTQFCVHFYWCCWETLSQDCILQLKFDVTAVSENTNENIIIAEVSLGDVPESCIFSPKC